MSPTATSVLVVLILIVLAAIARFAIRQERALRQSREQSNRTRSLNGVRQADLVEPVKAIARLRRAHDTTRSTVGLIQSENQDLKDELAWLLSELAVRPEPHQVVRLLYANGRLTLGELEEAVGPDVEVPIEDLDASFQVKPTVDGPEGDLKYEFIPHSQRPTTSPDLAPLNRCLSLLVDVSSVGEGPLDELDPRSYQTSTAAA